MDPRDGQQSGGREDDPLAYGDYPGSSGSRLQEEEGFDGGAEGERGLIGDTYRKVRDKYGSSQSKPSGGLGSFLFGKLQGVVQDIGSGIDQKLGGTGPKHSHTHTGAQCDDGMHNTSQHRYGSFAAQRTGNDAKWYVDGCGYMWAVSRALEQATESIWILDWWLSPELYLRRPPSKNEQYRLDRMLQAAAQRGVKVNVIVYKEVTQALTRKYLSPTLPNYLHSLLPRNTDPVTRALSGMGLAATFLSLEHVERENPLIVPPLTVCSYHTKHALEALHPNIAVFRHPDHLPDAQTLQSSFFSSLQHLSLSAKTASQLPEDALKAIYGMNEDVVLYWAHHEKLCLIDGKIAFMGGLDLCYGRWDTNQHPIADCHPSNLDDIVFPGQDYNNARIMDFQDVSHYQENKLDRRDSSRMGWSDISISLSGPVVEDLRAHFVEGWNFIYNEKYDIRKDTRYSRLTFTQNTAGTVPHQTSQAPPPASQPYQPYRPQQAGYQTASSSQGSGGYPPSPQGRPPQDYVQSPQTHGEQPASSSGANQGQVPYFPPPPVSSREIGGQNSDEEDAARGMGQYMAAPGSHHQHRERLEEKATTLQENMMGRFEAGRQYMSGNEHYSKLHGHSQEAGIPCQIVRSCTKWSHGIPTEHSVANAYISVIENSRHFVYIENQFFITATTDAQKPVKNKIGAAIVERIVRAARAGEKYKIIVIIPAVPGFAGDLKDDASLGTRAIMEFQYNSINRGGHSIMESIAKEGYDPTEYIRFYNLRNYDRLNVSGSMKNVEKKSGVNYEDARSEHDAAVELPAGDDSAQYAGRQKYQQYQQATTNMNKQQGLSGDWDSVSECYMLGGKDIRDVPWENGNIPEIQAFVSEELYIHSKVLIADDRVVICGSANLNDRSQLGDHDSEIACIIEDPVSVDSYMDGKPHRAARFAATLRRQLFRKHLGLLAPQNMEKPNQNFEPTGVPNTYDYGSREDQAVIDPLSDSFLDLWNSRAQTNSDAFGKIFHPVPHDSVLTWKDYNAFYEVFFKDSDENAEGKDLKKPAKYKWGHVVESNFSPGDKGTREVKDLLSTIRGTLVEMPLLFLIKEDIAKEGISLNAFTEDVYT
ncbi:MAG: hypothetical protein ASARMPREDX12_004937 [Alectoria sarmentosa]|nr:MAG: hypothetical protein ASARMPREDX12_004937 [Alectoria sarmentosa]